VKSHMLLWLLMMALFSCGRDKTLDQNLLNASALGNLEKAKRMLEAGADVNARDEQGWTSLMYASVDGNREVVQLLLDHGADVTQTNNTGQSAADIAQAGRRNEILELLRLHGGVPRIVSGVTREVARPNDFTKPASTGTSINEIALKHGTVRKGMSMNEVNPIVDRSVVAEAMGDTPRSATLSNIGGDMARWRFAQNGVQYELTFSRSTTPWSLSEIIQKDFSPNDFPDTALVRPPDPRKALEKVKISGIRIYQDPQGSDYAGWSTEVSFAARNSGTQVVEQLPFAVIAYNRFGQPNSLARFGPGAGEYTSWGVVEGALRPGESRRTDRFTLGVLYEKPSRVRIILLGEVLSESEYVGWAGK